MTDDSISRQAAIDAIDRYYKDKKYITRSRTMLSAICQDMKNIMGSLPSAQPEHGWIPCSERLPETTDPVYITWVNHKPAWYYEHIKDKPFVATGHYCNGGWYWFSNICQDCLNEYGDFDMNRIDSDVEVIAWMPNPAPYERSEE